MQAYGTPYEPRPDKVADELINTPVLGEETLRTEKKVNINRVSRTSIREIARPR